MTTGTPPSGTGAASPRWSRRWALHRTASLWPWTPMGVAAVYVVALLITLRSVIGGIYFSSDVAAAPLIGELTAHAPAGARITLGNIPWYSALWFEDLTRGLPAHRQLWEVLPWILGLVGIGLVAWATARVAGRWAGWIVAVTCACAGTALLPLQFAWSEHAVTYVHICVLAALMVPLALSDRWLGGRVWSHILLLLLVAVVTGLGVASDELVIVGGLAPLCVAGIVLACISSRARWLRLISVAGLVLISVGVAFLVRHIARTDHVVPAKFPITFAPANQLLNHVGDLLGSLMLLGNGNFGGLALSFTSALSLVCGGIVLLGTYAAFRYGRVAVLNLLPEESVDRTQRTREQVARTVFLAFWITSTVAVSVAFVVSSVPIGLGTSRYLVTAGYGLLVIVVIGLSGQASAWRKVILTAGISILLLGSVVGLVQKQLKRTQPDGAVATALLNFARSNGLKVGYAGYWDALAVTWELHDRLSVYPVVTCGTQLCQFPFHKISSWFRPRSGIHSFMVVDPALAVNNNVGGTASNFGPPLRVATVDGLQVWVYGYDIASKIGPSTY